MIDRKILGKLEIDSRTPLSRIGKSIRKSQQMVNYTVNSLIEKRILNGFYTILDYSKLGLLNFRVFFKLNYHNQKNFQELINYVKSDQHTSWVISCGGRYDLVCTFLTLNPSQFNKTLKGIIAKFPDQIQSYDVLTTIVIRWFGKKHMFKDQLKEIIYGGDREKESVDKNDLRILDELSQDARKSTVRIAEKLAITPKTVIERMKRLQKREIILGFKPLMNLRRFGTEVTTLLIRYHNFSISMENRLVNYLKVHPNVFCIVKTLGEWDIEINVETADPMEFRKVEMEIRQKFSQLIQHIESVPIYRTHKLNYFPGFLMENI